MRLPHIAHNLLKLKFSLKGRSKLESSSLIAQSIKTKVLTGRQEQSMAGQTDFKFVRLFNMAYLLKLKSLLKGENKSWLVRL